MKTYGWLSGLLVSFLLLLASCSSLPLKMKDRFPAAQQPKNQQVILAAVQTAAGKEPHLLARLVKKYKSKIGGLLGLFWLWLLARFHGNEKSRRIPGWQLQDLALLKIIKDNAARLWNMRCPDRKVIRLEDWKG